MKNCSFLFILTCVLAVSLAGCHSSSKVENLVVFHAGSLAIPFKQLKEEFEKKYPNINVVYEASGSVEAARKVTDLKKHADVVASSDYTVIEDMLIPKYADSYSRFAANEMVIMYSDKSRYADEINSENWFNILLRKGVNYGYSDPNSDPCGYRTLMTWQLAEKLYKEYGLYQRLRDGCPLKNIRPKETALLALLETGELDYIFIYRSVAEQHHGKYVLLPDQINLKTGRYADFYKEAQVNIKGKKPGEEITKKGEPMIYGIVALKEASNYQNALKFIEFLESPAGQRIMKENGQTPVN